MMTRVTIRAADVEAWRGIRGSGDAISGIAALVLTVTHHCTPPDETVPSYKWPAPEAATVVEIVGTPAELDELQAKLFQALTAETW
jgi:hypothetical protein